MGGLKLIAALLIALVTLPVAAIAETMNLQVTATYRERIALPPDAVLEVELLDTSRADAPSVRMSSQRFRLEAVPKTVQIPYDPSLIDERLTYTVAARIISGGRILFLSTTATPVLTRGAPDSAELVLEMMTGGEVASDHDQSIFGMTWAVFEIAGRMLVTEHVPILALDEDGRFGLFAGCNRFTGVLSASNGLLEVPQTFAGTQMACPEQRAQLERDVLDALASAERYVRNGSNLALTNQAGAVVLRLREVPQ